MSTIRQKKLAKAIVENIQLPKPKNKQELLASVGYSEITAGATSKVILEQKGVKDELALLGFTEEKAKNVVATILSSEFEEGNTRLRAADLIFKVYGTYAAEKSFNINVNSSVEEINSVIKNDLAKFRPNK